MLDLRSLFCINSKLCALIKNFLHPILSLIQQRSNRTNLTGLLNFLFLLGLLIILYSLIFHVVATYEGRSETFITGVYWTLTVMSTLGFGDVIFQSDLGKLFTVIVLLSGMVLLLILLPSVFIKFFYEPWVKALEASRAPLKISDKVRNHILIINLNPVTQTLIDKLKHYHYPYVLLTPDLAEAIRLHDLGYKVMLGELDNPKTYELARVHSALMVVTTTNDQINANIISTVREISESISIVSTANFQASIDILELAGCNHVLQLGEMMGQALARRVSNGQTLAHPIGNFRELIIAESTVRHTDLVGKTLQETRLREQLGVNVIGVWQRGVFKSAHPELLITEKTILVLAGLEEQISQYNHVFTIQQSIQAPILIIGGGRVGRATAQALIAQNLDYRIVEKLPKRILNSDKYILGDGAELEVLEQAGIWKTPVIIITTHDDDMNIYMTIYCRQLRPDAQIITRANLERNVTTLHRTGADFVLSYSSTGANAIINLIGRDNILMVSEGLDIFEVKVPQTLVGKSIAETDIRRETGCTLVAIYDENQLQLNINPYHLLPMNGRLILIGTADAEAQFLTKYKI